MKWDVRLRSDWSDYKAALLASKYALWSWWYHDSTFSSEIIYRLQARSCTGRNNYTEIVNNVPKCVLPLYYLFITEMFIMEPLSFYSNMWYKCPCQIITRTDFKHALADSQWQRHNSVNHLRSLIYGRGTVGKLRRHLMCTVLLILFQLLRQSRRKTASRHVWCPEDIFRKRPVYREQEVFFGIVAAGQHADCTRRLLLCYC